MCRNKFGIKKREHVSRGPTRKCWTNYRHERQRKKHENFVKLQRTIENITGLQFDPAGQVINLNKKQFTKENFKLLNINFNFVPTQTNFNKTLLTKNWKSFTDASNSKPILKIPKSKARFTEKETFRKPRNKIEVSKTITAA